MSEVLQRAASLRRPYAPHEAGQTTQWMCIDDRKKIGGPALYRQIAGSAAGIGYDWAAALEMNARRQDRHTSMSERSGLYIAPVHVLGGLAAKTLRHHPNRPVELLLHSRCIPELNGPEITGAIVSQPAEIHARAERILPGILPSTIYEVGYVYEQLWNTRRIADPVAAASQFARGGSWLPTWHTPPLQLDPIERVGVEGEHLAAHFFADYGKGVAYDVYAANQPESGQPLPAYHLSIGDLPGDIIEPLAKMTAIKTEDFLAATAVRHAAVTMALGLEVENIHMLPTAA